MQLKLLIVGGGGREHALTWALSNSSLAGEIHCAPGNPGMAEIAICHDVATNDLPSLLALAQKLAPDMIVIGPEAPLVAGLSDMLRAEGFRVFGPSKDAAQLEASKAFTKQLCVRHNIPTAKSKTAFDLQEALHIIEAWPSDFIVVKYDGLAAGKGVSVCSSKEEARAAAKNLLSGASPQSALVIEERLVGPEASLFVLCDGKTALPIGDAQDYKRALDGDRGVNTGGMGALSPAPALTDDLREQTMNEIVLPTLAALADMGTPYTGILFAGLMLTAQGPKLIEYNCRFGDPECQVLMPRLMSDLVPLLIAACDGQLHTVDVRYLPEVSVCLTLASSGYPQAPQMGEIIGNLEAVEHPRVTVFHAGTRKVKDVEGRQQLVSAGGRVLSVVGLGNSFAMARNHAYEAVAKINWPGAQYRRDIGASH